MPDLGGIAKLVAHRETRTIRKYLVVGFVSIAINYLTFLLCLALETGHFAAAVIGYGAGLLNSFVFGYLVVFRSRETRARRPIATTLLTFLIVYGVGGMTMGYGVDFGVKVLNLPATPTWLVVAAFVVVWNYLGSRFIVFKGAAE